MLNGRTLSRLYRRLDGPCATPSPTELPMGSSAHRTRVLTTSSGQRSRRTWPCLAGGLGEWLNVCRARAAVVVMSCSVMYRLVLPTSRVQSIYLRSIFICVRPSATHTFSGERYEHRPSSKSYRLHTDSTLYGEAYRSTSEHVCVEHV